MELKKEDLQIGTLAVLPGWGVGEVEEFATVQVEGQQVRTVRLHLRLHDTKVWIPEERVASLGLRALVDAARAEEVLQVVEEQEAPERRKHWNQRQRRYQEQMMSNRPRELARLLGELAAVRARKNLTITEKRIFRKARKLFVDELAAALGISHDRMDARLDERLPAAAA